MLIVSLIGESLCFLAHPPQPTIAGILPIPFTRWWSSGTVRHPNPRSAWALSKCVVSSPPGEEIFRPAAGKTCIARIRLRSLDLAVGCTVHPGIRDVMPADWPYRAIPSVTSAYRCISVTVWSLPQRYFSYRHVITFGIPVNVFLLFLRLFRLPACRTDRTRV